MSQIDEELVRGTTAIGEMQRPLLVLEGLSKAFAGLQAVRDVSLTVGDAEIVGIIGPNGAGKTTLLNLILGFLIPDRGTVIFDGVRVDEAPPHIISELGIARTFQQIRLFPRMTVLENCVAGMHNRFRSNLFDVLVRSRKFREETQSRIDEARALLQELGLESTENRLAGTLPYGQQRRLEIARALASKPKLVCLDEPAAGMNEAESKELSDAIRAFPNRGIGVLLIEHDMAVIRHASSRLIALNEGAILASGDPGTVLRHPEVVKAYLGSEHAGD